MCHRKKDPGTLKTRIEANGTEVIRTLDSTERGFGSLKRLYEILNLYFIFIGCSSASLLTFTAAHIKAYYVQNLYNNGIIFKQVFLLQNA